MEKSYIGITKRISGDLRKLRQDIPDTMKAFSALAQAAGRDGAIDKKTKELIACLEPNRRVELEAVGSVTK